jgi:predicted RND superfamily exporter protein
MSHVDDLPPMTIAFTRYPRTVIALILSVSLLFAFFAKDVERDHSAEGLLPANDPLHPYYDEFKKHFDIKAQIAIALSHEGGLYTTEMIAQVGRISDWLEASGFVEEVKSLTTVESITSSGGEILVGPLVKAIPETADELESLREAVVHNPMIHANLVSPDGNATLILARPNFDPWETFECVAIYDSLKKMLAEDPGPGKAYVAGYPIITGLADKYMDRDNRVMMPLVSVVVILLLFLAFRSLRGVWIPLAVVVAAIVWTFGAMHLAGVKITIISTSIPIILMAMGIADGIHVISEYYHQLGLGKDNRSAVLHTMKEMNAPVVMTSITTAVGFLALWTADIVPIREFGAAVAFGIMAAMVFSLSFIPACLVLLGKPKRLLTIPVSDRGGMQGFSRAIGGASLHYAKPLIAVFVIGVVVTGAISTQLRARQNPVHYFRSHSEIRTSSEFIDAHFPGTGAIHIQVDSGEEGGLKDPDLPWRIGRLQDRLESMEEVGNTRSMADFLARMHLLLHDGDPSFDRVPGPGDDLDPDVGRALIGQYLLLYEMSGGTELADTVDDEYRRANIEVNVKSNSSDVFKGVIETLDEAAAELFAHKASIGSLGNGVINLKMIQYLVVGQIYSLAVSYAVVLLILVIMFRSFLYALIGVIPLIITITFSFALMVISGIPLNMGTALIASVCIGIGVDYSIHFIHRYRIEATRSNDLASTIQVTMETSGRAILLNAVAVAGGFSVLLFSSFMPVVYLGLLIPLIMATNALAALLIIPAFLNALAGSRGKQTRGPGAFPAP